MAALKGYVKECDESVVWQEVSCPLCGSAQAEELIAVERDEGRGVYRVARCRACGLGYMNPRPDPSSIGQLYPEEYECYHAPEQRRAGSRQTVRARLERLVQRFYLGDPPPVRTWHAKALAFLAGAWLRPGRDSLLSLPFHGAGRLLDFGCGSGWFAHRMQKRGWTVTGIDASAHSARHVALRFAIPVLVGTLPHSEIEPESFDVITMGCVLEHVHWPQEVIAAATQALRPGGLLVISVPNIASWGFRYFGKDWWPLELPRHLLHFTPASLRRLVESHGLEVCQLRMLARTSWMRRSLAAAHFTQSVPIFPRTIASLLTRWSVLTDQADCILLVARRPDAGVQPIDRACQFTQAA